MTVNSNQSPSLTIPPLILFLLLTLFHFLHLASTSLKRFPHKASPLPSTSPPLFLNLLHSSHPRTLPPPLPRTSLHSHLKTLSLHSHLKTSLHPHLYVVTSLPVSLQNATSSTPRKVTLPHNNLTFLNITTSLSPLSHLSTILHLFLNQSHLSPSSQPERRPILSKFSLTGTNQTADTIIFRDAGRCSRCSIRQ